MTIPADFSDGDSFVERLQTIYGDMHAEAILERMGQPDTQVCFWVNPLIAPMDTPDGRPVPHVAGLYCSEDRTAVTHSAAAEAGAIYVQNASSFYAVGVLDPQPGEEILDLAAAPGGKSIAIAARMQNQGRLAVVEPVRSRFHRLQHNLQRCGVTMAASYRRDGREVGRAVGERFDRVLLDAPCSSEARMRWFDPSSYRHWQLRKVKEASRKQKALIRSAYAALKPGGCLLYSTCSFASEENELIVSHLLKRTDAELLPIVPTSGCSIPGLTAYNGRAFPEALALTLRIVPDALWDGFYMALFKKPG